MTFLNKTCVNCGDKFHYCRYRDINWSSAWLAYGFCSEECARGSNWVDPWADEILEPGIVQGEYGGEV